MLSVIGTGIFYFLSAIETAIFVSVILSWFIDPYSRILQLLYAVTEPFVAPIRALLSKFMGDMPMIDFSPMIAMLIISLLKQMFLVIFS
ncbi:MAG: YggT family protein [Clostridia bacterium]|nr:YggT family protein [Clostridiales bacterium]MBQ6716316.1 YggT family protein [Clostridia bacterium]